MEPGSFLILSGSVPQCLYDRFFHSSVDLYLDGEASEDLTSLYLSLYGCPDGYKCWVSRRLSIRAFARDTSTNTVSRNMSSPSKAVANKVKDDTSPVLLRC